MTHLKNIQKFEKKNKFKLETLDFEMGSIVIYFLFMDDTVSIRTNLLEIYLKKFKKKIISQFIEF